MTARCCRSIGERALQIDVANSRTRATKTNPQRQQARRMCPIFPLLVNYCPAILIYELDVRIERRVGRTRRARARFTPSPTAASCCQCACCNAACSPPLNASTEDVFLTSFREKNTGSKEGKGSKGGGTKNPEHAPKTIEARTKPPRGARGGTARRQIKLHTLPLHTTTPHAPPTRAPPRAGARSRSSSPSSRA